MPDFADSLASRRGGGKRLSNGRYDGSPQQNQSPQQQQQQQQQLQQQQQRQQHPAAAAANAYPLLSFSQTEDLKVLSGLIDELSDALESNRTATEDLLREADQIFIDEEDDDTKTIDGDAQEEELNSLKLENSSLRKQIAAQRTKCNANIKFLKVCMFSYEKCLTMLRQYVHERTLDTLKIHRDYIAKTEAEQDIYTQLNQERAELESKIFTISRALGMVVRTASTNEDTKRSVEYKQGIYEMISDYQDFRDDEVHGIFARDSLTSAVVAGNSVSW